MTDARQRLRVALLAGTLSQGGAEKQLVYLVDGLLQMGADIRVFSLTRHDFYERALIERGVHPIWIGRSSIPAVRLFALALSLRRFRPHIVQSAHFFTNLYVSVSARLSGAVSIGTLRSDLAYALRPNGMWGKWLLNMASALIANSYTGKRDAERAGLRPETVRVLPNVIDLRDFDSHAQSRDLPVDSTENTIAIAVARLVPTKRLERFLQALVIARREVPGLKGLIVGDGPERTRLESKADQLGLLPGGVTFLGARSDVPALLRQADMLVLCSDHEGFPNVILEAMAARLPVITTPAGDAGTVVRNGVTGYVVPFEDAPEHASRMVRLAESSMLRHKLGQAGRKEVESNYSLGGLSDRLLRIYRDIARTQAKPDLLNILRT